MVFAQFHGQLCILEFMENLFEVVQMVFCGLNADNYLT